MLWGLMILAREALASGLGLYGIKSYHCFTMLVLSRKSWPVHYGHSTATRFPQRVSVPCFPSVVLQRVRYVQKNPKRCRHRYPTMNDDNETPLEDQLLCLARAAQEITDRMRTRASELEHKSKRLLEDSKRLQEEARDTKKKALQMRLDCKTLEQQHNVIVSQVLLRVATERSKNFNLGPSHFVLHTSNQLCHTPCPGFGRKHTYFCSYFDQQYASF
jgi:hypothetical protein